MQGGEGSVFSLPTLFQAIFPHIALSVSRLEEAEKKSSHGRLVAIPAANGH